MEDVESKCFLQGVNSFFFPLNVSYPKILKNIQWKIQQPSSKCVPALIAPFKKYRVEENNFQSAVLT